MLAGQPWKSSCSFAPTWAPALRATARATTPYSSRWPAFTHRTTRRTEYFAGRRPRPNVAGRGRGGAVARREREHARGLADRARRRAAARRRQFGLEAGARRARRSTCAPRRARPGPRGRARRESAPAEREPARAERAARPSRRARRRAAPAPSLRRRPWEAARGERRRGGTRALVRLDLGRVDDVAMPAHSRPLALGGQQPRRIGNGPRARSVAVVT